jgi:DNA repair protein RAD7
MERDVPLRTLKLEAANLISNEKWREFFGRAGRRLEVLKLTWLDYAMDDETFAHLIDGCPNLTYLKIKKCFRLTAASLKLIPKLEKLEHLSLLVANTADQETLLDLIRSVGRNLRVLSLERFDNADDQVLQEINANCVKLHKLRFSANDFCTDAGFQALFEGWKNPGLSYVDFSECRDIDHDAPDGPEDDPVGLASGGFEALMAHSGLKLERLNIKSCRHISHAALTHVFDGKKRYPSLKEIDLSFVKSVDTLVMAGIFKSCPAIEKVTAFSCFNIKDVVVPAGVALIGVPNAQDSIVQEGRFLGDIMMQDYC